jgi:hypothetical protein
MLITWKKSFVRLYVLLDDLYSFLGGVCRFFLPPVRSARWLTLHAATPLVAFTCRNHPEMRPPTG